MDGWLPEAATHGCSASIIATMKFTELDSFGEVIVSLCFSFNNQEEFRPEVRYPVSHRGLRCSSRIHVFNQTFLLDRADLLQIA